jgi:c(7)-type cytochrome triheme protein
MTRQTKKTKTRMPPRRWCEFVVLVAGCLVFGYFFASCSKPENKVEIIPTDSAPVKQPEFSPVPAINPDADFSNFKHSNPEHARFPCALCHERTDNSPTPKRSGHMPCAGCHVAQFADNKNAICTICHSNPETAAVKSFPALKSFNVVFDHAKHLPKTNCATCHKPERNGVAQSIPSSLNAHNSCFACHSPGAKSGEENIDSCSVCHQPGKSAKVSEWARTFETTPFSHASHRLDCATCHAVKAGAARGRQVTTALVAAMHFPPRSALSCASCHNNKKAFGGDDFQDCRRCHWGNNFKFS